MTPTPPAPTRIDRRTFLAGLAGTAAIPLWARLGPAIAWGDATPAPGAIPTPEQLLLVVYLQGGNDPLNTIVPIADPLYASHRGGLALGAAEVLPIGSGTAMHASLPWLHGRWLAGQVAAVQSVGFPGTILSHFESAEIWETASPEGRLSTGWLGRYLDATDGSRRGHIRAVAVRTGLPTTLVGTTTTAASLTSVADLALPDEAGADGPARRAARRASTAGAGTSTLLERAARAQSASLDLLDAVASAPDRRAATHTGHAVAQALAAGLGCEAAWVQMNGFDTHSDQRRLHAERLGRLDDLLASYFAAASELGIAGRTTALVFSEFGRRVPVNGSLGTDHGAAGTVLLVGPRVRGGLHGAPPDLADLADGNLRHRVDLRSVYASVLEQVLRHPHDGVLGATFPTLPLVS